MGRKLLIALVALGLGACQDPIVIIGDLPGFMRLVAGVPNTEGIHNDTASLKVTLTRPAGLAVGSSGVLYIADQSSRIISMTSNGRTTVLAQALGCFDKTCMGRPQGIAVSPDERTLYIADDMSDKIWRLTIANNDLVAVAGTGTNGVSPDGTPAAQANLASPNGVVVLPDGRVAFAERNAHKIRVIGTDGVLRTLAGNGTQGNAADNVSATTSPLNLPSGLALANNVLYITETGSHTIRSVDLASGIMRLIAGDGSAGFKGDGGPATQASFNNPSALAVSDNNLYVADRSNDRVRLVNLQSGTITTFAGTGTRVYNGNGRGAAETSLYFPNGLAVSPFGFLYISDSGHSVVWRTAVRANIQ